MDSRICRQPDIVLQCDEYTKYIAYDQQNGMMVYQYDFKAEQYTQQILKYVPRDLYIDLFVNKNGLPTLYTPIRPGTQLLSILQREAISTVKLSKQLIKNWVENLLEDVQIRPVYRPRLDFVYIDSQQGRAYFELQAYLPFTASNSHMIAERFEKMFQLKLTKVECAQQLVKWLYHFQMIHYNNQQQNIQFEESEPASVQCKHCKPIVFLFKSTLDLRSTAESQMTTSSSAKKFFEMLYKYSNTSHSDSNCQIVKMLQTEPSSYQPKNQFFIKPNVFVNNVSVKLCYTLASILTKGTKPIQNLLTILDSLEVTEFDLGLAIENFETLPYNALMFFQKMINTEQTIPELINEYKSLSLKVSYKNKRDMSQNMVVTMGQTQKCVAILKDDLDETIKAVQEELVGFAPTHALERAIRENPPVW
ncbi:Conserved_hypothetical protein [Hexamita inflata]|uniref:Uncharacterized protein n=1 Tax=Hexamita inflata TaxID=28002 RepID=A0ABP1HHW0_9EUKA